MDGYETYFALLGEITDTLERLTGTAREKAESVRQDDLATLDSVIKREQALALTLRGCEQKRSQLVAALGLEGSSLAELPSRCPPPLRANAEAAAEALRRAYRLYGGAADAARTLLEINLHQIDRFLTGEQGSAAGPGYSPQTPPEPPPHMKTDFRA